jgi:phosphoribosylformylglycinamidine synthase
MLGVIGNKVPRVDLDANLALYRKLHAAIRQGLVASAHDCSDGGLWVALAESALAGRLGCEVDLGLAPQDSGLTPTALLFGESQGRFVVTVAAENSKDFEALMAESHAACVGAVTDNPRILANIGTTSVLETTVDEALEYWRRPLDF